MQYLWKNFGTGAFSEMNITIPSLLGLLSLVESDVHIYSLSSDYDSARDKPSVLMPMLNSEEGNVVLMLSATINDATCSTVVGGWADMCKNTLFFAKDYAESILKKTVINNYGSVVSTTDFLQCLGVMVDASRPIYLMKPLREVLIEALALGVEIRPICGGAITDLPGFDAYFTTPEHDQSHIFRLMFRSDDTIFMSVIGVKFDRKTEIEKNVSVLMTLDMVRESIGFFDAFKNKDVKLLCSIDFLNQVDLSIIDAPLVQC